MTDPLELLSDYPFTGVVGTCNFNSDYKSVETLDPPYVVVGQTTSEIMAGIA